MSREMTELMTRGSRRDPTLTPLQRAVYRGKMLSLQRRGIDRSSAMLRPSEGFVYWKNHIVMRVARHFDSVIIITGDVGTGKPLGRGQGVLMHDGSVKKVEDILVGDVVMGPNSEPRHVLDITAGYGPLVRVIPLKTDPFIVGAEHPLTVRQTSRTSPIGRALVSPRGQGHARGWRRPRKTSCAPPTTNYEALQSGGWLRDIPAYNFLTKTNRSQWKLLQSEELSFAHRSELPLSPWLVGALLGDGALTVARRVGFTKSDAEVLRRYREELLRLSLVPKEYQKAGHAAINIVLFGDTVLARTLTSLGLLPITCERRFIPSEYLRATVAERMELLAGLLDTDGDVGPSGECNYTSKSRQLVSDVVFLARSLGFKTHFREMHKCDQNKTWGTYYACSIIGDTIRIPLVSQHKKERLKTHDSFKLPLVEGFRVELAGEGAHYCIVVDGDHRFLMSNFLFTHNSTLALRLAQSFEPGFDIKRLCYSASDLLEAYETVQPGQVVLFDESVRGLQAGDQSTREQKALIQALVLVREKGAILMLCVPDIFLIAKQIRQKRATLWLHVMERGVALIHERNSYLRYEADNTLGFSRSRNVPLLEWKPFKSTDKLWIAYQDLKRRRLDEYLHETKELLSGKKKGPQAGETKKEYNARRQRERRERMAVSTSEPEPVSNPDTTPLDDEPRGKNRMQKALEKAAETPVSAETK